MAEKQQSDLEPAYLIHRRAFRESSAILEVFSENHGRLGIVARGANRPRSPLRASLSPFVPLLMSWSGRGELATLRSVEVANVVAPLSGDALLSGMYLNELLMRLTHRHDPHPELFHAYRIALCELGAGQPLQHCLRMFEKRILDAIGYGLVLDVEAERDVPVVAEQRYRYIADRGPTRDPDLPGECVEISGQTLLALAGEQPMDDAAQREAKRLMRFALGIHLGGRPLASRELFRT